MAFLFKIAFYLMFAMSCFFVLFFIGNAIHTFMDAYGKKSEALIMVLGSGLMGTGTYYAFQVFHVDERYLHGCGVMGLTWLITLIIVLVGLFFFNGPIRWN